jgi:hypothetical protein
MGVPDSAEAALYRFENSGTAGNLVQAGTVHGGVHFLLATERTEAGRLSDVYVRALSSAFVTSQEEEFEAFVRHVRKGFGVVVGVSGTGRRTAAVVALARLNLPVRPVAVEEDEKWEPAKLVCESRQGYLIEMPESSGDRLRQNVYDFAARAERHDSVVIVVAGPDTWAEAGTDGAAVLRHRQPPAEAVFTGHLAEHLRDAVVEPRATAEAWVRDARVSQNLSGARPRDAARLAELAAHARAADPKASIDAVIDGAVSAYRNWAAELRKWFNEHEGERVYDRVVLAAVAMLEGMPADEVLVAAVDFAAALDIAPSDATRISGPGLDAAVDAVHAEVDGDRRVRFRRIEYAAAVLDYLWWQHPWTRAPLLEWITRLAAQARYASWRAPLARKWARLAQQHDAPEWATEMFVAWAESSVTQSAVVDVAAEIAADPRAGRDMRRRLYHLAKNTQSRTLAVAIAQVCAEYGKTDPTTALTRLKWLADRDDVDVRTAVLTALERLSHRAEVRPILLRELAVWMTDRLGRGRAETARAAAAVLLCEHGEPNVPTLIADVLDSNSAVSEADVGAIWRGLLGPEHVTEAEPVVRVWVDAVVTRHVAVDVVGSVFATAVDGSSRRSVPLQQLIGSRENLSEQNRADLYDLGQWVQKGDPLHRPKEG